MVRTSWLAFRRPNRQSRANVEASNSACPLSSETEIDDGNSRTKTSLSAGSDQKTGYVKDAHNWTSLSPCGTKPEPRYDHAATVVGRKMVVVGGECSDGLLNDVQVLHLGKLYWSAVGPTPKIAAKEGLSKALQCPQPPACNGQCQQLPACKGHSLVSWDKLVLLIGGQMDPPSDHVSVWAFDMESERWSRIEAKGDIPVARSGQTVTKASSILIMFGGEDAKGRKLKDLHMFDLKSFMWLPLQTTGAGPSPRSKHVAALHDDRFLLIFGGASKSKALNDLFSLDFETMEWSKIKTRGFSPSPRAGCGAVLSGDKWYITGGKGQKTRCLETLVFDVSTMTWSNVPTSASSSILSNQGFSLVLIERKEGTFLVAFGGYNTEYSNEVELLITSLPEANVNCCTSTQKELVQREDSLTSTQERTPRVLAPVVAGGKHPCSCITVAKNNLTTATDHHGSIQKSLSEESAGNHSSDIAGILPLCKLFQHEEEFSAEVKAQRNFCGSKENEHSGQPVKESTNRQGRKHFEVVERTRQTNAMPSVPEGDTQIPSELHNFEIIETNEDGSTKIEEEKVAWQGTCQNGEPGSRIKCRSGTCAQLPLEMLPRNKTLLSQDSERCNFMSEFHGEAINARSLENMMGSLSDIQEQYEVMLADALKKNAITEKQLSAAIASKEAAEKSLSAVLKVKQNSETKLSETLKKVEVLKEKVAAAELVQEDANNLSNIVHAENVRLEHDMAFLKAVMDDTQKELHTTRGILTAERTRAFQLQVEVFQLRQKLQSAANRASTPQKSYQL